MPETNVGSPKGREPYGDTVPVVVAVYELPGRTGRPSTGRRGTSDRTPISQEVCEMQSAEVVLGVLREYTA